MPSSVRFDSAALIRVVQQAMADGLNAGAIELQNIMRVGLSKVYPRTRIRAGTRRDGTKTRRAMFNAAPPGAYPGKRTGNLRQSMQVRLATPQNLSAAAGVAASAVTVNTYALHLEFGTRKMAARPWAYRSLSENRGRIGAAIRAAAQRRLAASGLRADNIGYTGTGPDRITPNAGAD